MDLLLKNGIGRFLLNGTALSPDSFVYAEGGQIDFTTRPLSQQQMVSDHVHHTGATAAVIYSIYTS